MYYYLYKITNKVDGKIYVGAHKTNNLDDGYMGSGKYLKEAIKKHGIENFEKKILRWFDNEEEMYEEEAEIVNEDWIASKNTYNIRLGGNSGFDFAMKKFIEKYGENWGKILSDKGNKAIKEKYPEGTWKGKKHNEESKRKIGKANSEHQKGSNNNQYGTCWIYNDELKQSKKINKEELNYWLEQGWQKGRKMKW